MRPTIKRALRCAAVVAVISPIVATADPFRFVITGGYNATFDIDSARLPDYFNSTSFDIDNVVGTFVGRDLTGGTAPVSASSASLIQFYSSSFGGGLGISANGLTRFVGDGSQLYSGATSTPTFLPGQYVLAPEYTYAASALTISRVAAAVPEPATWGMMIVGFGVIGAVMRRRVRVFNVRFDAKIKRISEGVPG